MIIQNNILKSLFRNVYFLNGTAYAGKSTMVRLLAEKHNGICCGENYHDVLMEHIDPVNQPNLSYFQTMSGWQEFVTRSPETYDAWMTGCAREIEQLEIICLLRLCQEGKPIFVDTNISPAVLHEISDYHHVAILLCDPPDITSRLFFNREDPDKKFMLEQINKCKDPEATLKNFNSWALYHTPVEIDWEHTGFFTYNRSAF